MALTLPNNLEHISNVQHATSLMSPATLDEVSHPTTTCIKSSTTIESLPNETLITIIKYVGTNKVGKYKSTDYVYWCENAYLRRLAQCSRQFHSVAIPIMHETFVQKGDNTLQEFQHYLIANPVLGLKVKTFVATSPDIDGEDDDWYFGSNKCVIWICRLSACQSSQHVHQPERRHESPSFFSGNLSLGESG